MLQHSPTGFGGSIGRGGRGFVAEIERREVKNQFNIIRMIRA